MKEDEETQQQAEIVSQWNTYKEKAIKQSPSHF
jgi:hypothetical protein